MMRSMFSVKEKRVKPSSSRALSGPAFFMFLILGGTAIAAPRSSFPAADTLSIAECVAMARRAAPEVQARRSEREAARLDSIATSHNRRPAFSLFGGTTLSPKGFYDPALTNLGDYELKAGLELPIRDGGSRRRERLRSAIAVRDAAIESERASRDAGLRAAELALDALRVREQSVVLRETLDWLDRLVVLVASGVRAGSRDLSDADRVALERDAVQSELETLEQSRGALRRELSELLGRSAGVEVEVREFASGEEAPPAEPDSVAMFERADHTPEVRAARVAESQAQLALEEVRRRNALRVDLTADAGVWGADLTHSVPPDLAASNPDATFADRLRQDLGASVALRFQRPVLDVAAGYSATARERALRAAQTRTAAARTERMRASLDLLDRWRTSARRLALADSSSARASDHLLRLRSLYAAGASTLLELLDARGQLDDARGRRADALRETRMARWEQELQR
jgi:outer membrane protein TolC